MDKYLMLTTSIVAVTIFFFTACGELEKTAQYDVSHYSTPITETSVVIEITTKSTAISLVDNDRISAEFLPINTFKVTSEITTFPQETTSLEDNTSQTEQYYTGLSNIEFDMVCAVVQAEADSGSLQFKEYIVGIIYNRINSEDFPNTAYDVLTQPNQFGSISNYYSNTYPIDDDTRLAVSRIFGGYDTYILYNLNGAVSYCNPNLVNNSTLNWFETSLSFTYQCTEYINGITWVHRFYALP